MWYISKMTCRRNAGWHDNNQAVKPPLCCVCCVRSHERQVHSVQDEPCQRRGVLGVGGEEVVDPPADRGERRERRRPHRHLENEARRVPPSSCFIFSRSLLWSMKTTLFLISFYPGSALFRKYGRPCVQVTDETFSHFDMQWQFRTSYFFLCDFHSSWLLIFYAGTSGVKADCDRKGHVFMKQTNKLLLLFVFSTVLLFHVEASNCVDAATIICDVLSALSLSICLSPCFR